MQFASKEIQQWAFESAQSSPGVWLIQACQLRDAARRIDWIDAAPAEMLITSFPTVYRFLISLSTENLIKGILIAERVRRGEPDPFDGLMNHRLHVLAEKIEGLQKPLSNDERDVLASMASYIEWAGRYPFPKKLQSHQPRGHSGAEHALEIELWERLAAHLKRIGWVSKGHPDHEGWHWMFT